MKNLKLVAIASAVMTSSSVYALPPTATPAYIIYAGGGSAQQKAVAWMQDQLLSNVDIYSTSCSGKADSSYQIAFGTLKAAIGSVPAGTNVLIEYKFNGGSFPNGVQPQGLGTTLPYPNNGGVAGGVACSGQSYPLPTYSISSGSAVNFVPDWGLADVEVKLLNNQYNVPGATTANVLPPAKVANIQSVGIYENIFGIAVTKNVTTAACAKTNFSKEEMAFVLSGNATDWSQLQGDNGCSIAAGPIVLLDRAAGSGSKAAGNLYFLGYPNAGFTVPGNSAYGTTGTLCDGNYDDINEGSNGAIVSDLNTAGGGSCRAIAILGGEFPPALNSPGNYAFEKISGVDPGLNVAHGGTISYSTVISGDYDFFYTDSFNYRTASVSGTPQHYSGDGTFYGNAINTVKTTLQSASIPSGVAGSTATAPSGVLLDPGVIGALKPCTTRATHNLISQGPLSLLYDFSVVLPTPACADGV